MPKLVINFLIFILICSPVLASEQGPPEGLWRGNLAGKPINVVFESEDPGYFYTKILKPISLRNSSDYAHWTELSDKNITGYWNLENISAQEIIGTWQSADKKQEYVIKLRKLNSIPRTYYSGTYSLANAYKQKIGYGKQTFFNKYSYRTIASQGVSSIELAGDSKNIHELNELLKAGLYAELSNYFSCPSSLEMSRGKNPNPEYTANVGITFWDKDWIVFEHYISGDCGGTHPFASNDRITINLHTLENTNLDKWIEPGLSEKNNSKLYALIANKAIERRHSQGLIDKDDDCADVLKDTRNYTISIGNEGLVFSTNFEYVTYACSDDIEIRYAELMPYLSRQGKEAVKSLKRK